MDTEEDLLKVRKLFSSHEPRPWEITLDEAITRMDRLATQDNGLPLPATLSEPCQQNNLL